MPIFASSMPRNSSFYSENGLEETFCISLQNRKLRMTNTARKKLISTLAKMIFVINGLMSCTFPDGKMNASQHKSYRRISGLIE